MLDAQEAARHCRETIEAYRRLAEQTDLGLNDLDNEQQKAYSTHCTRHVFDANHATLCIAADMPVSSEVVRRAKISKTHSDNKKIQQALITKNNNDTESLLKRRKRLKLEGSAEEIERDKIRSMAAKAKMQQRNGDWIKFYAMAPAARPAFKKGPGGTSPSIEAAGHLAGKAPGDLGAQARPGAPRSDRDGARSCSCCCCVEARCAFGPGPPHGAAEGGQGRGLGRSCFARWPGAHARPGQQGHARRRQPRGAGAGLAPWLWARGVCPQVTRQHNKGPAGGGQAAQRPQPWPRVGIHMHRPRARGATLPMACAGVAG